MKLTKHTNNIKSRIVSFASMLALVLCTVLSFVLIVPDRRAFADDAQSAAAKKTANGIRFAQVAAGEDFAIGLTYDGKLYGWSLTNTTGSSIADARTLGDVYTATPTEIKVVFRRGPQGENKWSDTDTTNGYHAVRNDDKIKSIAATRTTAAFVTELGYLYTWGNDTLEDVDHNDDNRNGKHYLLLRNTDVSREYQWQTPYIIDYYFYNDNDARSPQELNSVQRTPTEQLIPQSTGTDRFTALAAGEYNYIFMFERFATDVQGSGTSGVNWSIINNESYYYTYVWGSVMYNAPNTAPSEEKDYSTSAQESAFSIAQHGRKVFNTKIRSRSNGALTGNVSVVAGGYTVGINNQNEALIEPERGGSTLMLRGRNFITTQGLKDGAVQQTTKLLDEGKRNSTSIKADSGTYTGAIAGGGHYFDGTSEATDNGQLYGKDAELYYARQSGDMTTTTVTLPTVPEGEEGDEGEEGEEVEPTVTTTTKHETIKYATSAASSSILGSDGKAISNSIQTARYAVALGNDIGYGIWNNKLYGWGDNAYGQLVGVAKQYSDEVTPLLANVTNVVSVAAGKQTSKESKAFYRNTGTITDNAFNANVKNNEDYISAVLTGDGYIHAWSNTIAEAQKLYYLDVDGSSREKFAAVYSGYGNNLFAVTETGKLVRITAEGGEFKQYVYETFADVNDKEYDNWTVNSTNKLVFSPEAATVSNPTPNFGTATLYLWGAVATGNGIKFNNDEAATAYNTLVSANNIGDAYRILGKTASDAILVYRTTNEKLKKDNLSATVTDANYYAPKFYFDGNEMTPAQQKNMFNFVWTYDATYGVGFAITPNQSSKGKEITVKFNIARFNNYDKYKVSGETVTDNAIYYDHKECAITFSIDDTPTQKTFSSFGTDKNCTIPLLDPNNKYNKYFSVAVQNVSEGVNKLNAFLTSTEGAVNTDMQEAILTEMKKDAGFPDSAKKDKGNLGYYLNALDLEKYNDAYTFLYTDRDSDFIQISAPAGGIIGANSGFKASKETITVKVECALSSAFKDKTTEEINKAISTDFDNKYGLYGITYTVEADKGYISFKYDVIRFEATASSGVLEYSANSVTSYQTDSNSPAGQTASIGVYTVVSYGYNKDTGYVSGYDPEKNSTFKSLTGDNIITVFSNPSLRIESYAGNEADVNGQADGNQNTFTVIDGDTLYVGDTKTIELNNFISGIGSNISFSYNNSASEKAFSDYNLMFTDDTAHGVDIIKLSGSKIEVSPSTPVPLHFTVEIQRFVDASKTTVFENAKKAVDEKIYLTFKFTNILGFTLSSDNAAKLEYLITNKAGNASTEIDLFGETEGVANLQAPFITITNANGGNLPAKAYDKLKSNASIFNISSSEDKKEANQKLFECKLKSNTVFEITPLRSGSGILQFTANVYNQSVAFTLKINVSSLTELDKTNYLVTVDNDQYVYVNTLLNVLQQTNSYNTHKNDYKVLYDDVQDATASVNDMKYNAVYFTDKDDNRGMPGFIKNVVFEDTDTNAYMRIISNNSPTLTSETYYMHVQFTYDKDAKTYAEAKAETIIEMIVPVESGRIKLQDATSASDLIAKIDCRHTDKHADWWTVSGNGLDTKVTISLSSLLKMTTMASPELYEILLVSSADNTAANYFNYTETKDKLNIVITPKLNTIDDKTKELRTFELNVSIYNKNNAFDTKVVSFEVSVDGIISTLPVMTDDGIIGYGNIWLYSFAIVFGVLLVIFVIRFIIYVRRRSKQRAIIKRNQELIRMRDRMHGKASAATREQLVKSKLKMEDPKYAKMFNDMRKDKEEDSGVMLENSDLAAIAEKKVDKKKKKKGGKKSVADLKAELEAKKAAFAAAQAGNAQPVNPFATDIPIDGGGFVPPDGGYGAPDAGFGAPDGFAQDAGFGGQGMDGSDIVFDASDLGDGNM